MQLAGKTGGGLTSLPADEATLAARIERSQQTWRGELPKSEQGYVFVLEDTASGAVAGICAIEVAVGLNDPGTTTASAPGSRLERAERL
jgi:arginine N-succinyltransferase